jgi:nicotinate dehydrogenase subunit A
MVDGRAVFSCLTPIAALEGRQIRTVEGLGTVDQPSRLQAAFLIGQAPQCGYCIAGMIMRAQALLDEKQHPTEAESGGARPARKPQKLPFARRLDTN